MHFGEHLTIDGYGGSYNKLNSEQIVYSALNELSNILGMKKLSKPVVLYAPSNDKKDPGGWSGFLVIAESHISVHTFPHRGFVSIDVYTCQNDLNTNIVEDYFIGSFDLKDIEVNFLKRGTRYPEKDIY
ncbi:MAG: S-adenosylmethionine decarboxylase [Melioribacteraceae bacterium]